mmetsp:Transcript_18643/g.55256  ORF Transcript_18643/g.55256 Transcript_18643/m.55256 type:complete len:232 (-) Transcript_18643:2755-3450(-)
MAPEPLTMGTCVIHGAPFHPTNLCLRTRYSFTVALLNRLFLELTVVPSKGVLFTIVTTSPIRTLFDAGPFGFTDVIVSPLSPPRKKPKTSSLTRLIRFGFFPFAQPDFSRDTVTSAVWYTSDGEDSSCAISASSSAPACATARATTTSRLRAPLKYFAVMYATGDLRTSSPSTETRASLTRSLLPAPGPTALTTFSTKDSPPGTITSWDVNSKLNGSSVLSRRNATTTSSV